MDGLSATFGAPRPEKRAALPLTSLWPVIRPSKPAEVNSRVVVGLDGSA